MPVSTFTQFFLECSSYSFSWNVFLYPPNLQFYFCVFGRLFTFLILEKRPTVQGHPVHPATSFPLVTDLHALQVLSMWVCGLSCFGGLTTMGSLVGCEALPWAEAATTG